MPEPAPAPVPMAAPEPCGGGKKGKKGGGKKSGGGGGGGYKKKKKKFKKCKWLFFTFIVIAFSDGIIPAYPVSQKAYNKVFFFDVQLTDNTLFDVIKISRSQHIYATCWVPC
jgi:hypothetical protein